MYSHHLQHDHLHFAQVNKPATVYIASLVTDHKHRIPVHVASRLFCMLNYLVSLRAHQAGKLESVTRTLCAYSRHT